MLKAMVLIGIQNKLTTIFRRLCNVAQKIFSLLAVYMDIMLFDNLLNFFL